MADRLTKEREAEIRADVEAGRWGAERPRTGPDMVRVWFGKDDTANGLEHSEWFEPPKYTLNQAVRGIQAERVAAHDENAMWVWQEIQKQVLAAKGAALMDAQRRTQAPVTEPPATTVLARRDDGATCRGCGGPAYLGLGMGPPKCCAEPCPGPGAVPGPTVREVWVSFYKPPVRPGTGVRNVWPAPVEAGCERWWQASGQGREVNHPIREEAVRLWWAGAK